MQKLDKNPKTRTVVNIDNEQYKHLKIKASNNYITITHLTRILIALYIQGKIDISDYVPKI